MKIFPIPTWIANKCKLDKFNSDTREFNYILRINICDKLSEYKHNDLIYNMVFDDIEDNTENGLLFTEQEAIDLLDHIKMVLQDEEHKIKNIIINCKGGLSRSPAVACAISDIYGLNLYKESFPCLNNYVYNTIMDVHNKMK